MTELPKGFPLKGADRMTFDQTENKATVTGTIKIDLPFEPHPLVVIAAIQEALAKVPAECIDSAVFYERAYADDYGLGEDRRIEYQRPETPAETAAREKEEHRRRRVYDALEQREYRRLKAKFGGGVDA